MTEVADTPKLACTLNDGDFKARRAVVRKQLLPRASRSEDIEDGICLVFPEAPELKLMVEAFVLLERQCCGFLDFTISVGDREIRLSITAPPEAMDTLNGLVERMIAGDT